MEASIYIDFIFIHTTDRPSRRVPDSFFSRSSIREDDERVCRERSTSERENTSKTVVVFDQQLICCACGRNTIASYIFTLFRPFSQFDVDARRGERKELTRAYSRLFFFRRSSPKVLTAEFSKASHYNYSASHLL